MEKNSSSPPHSVYFCLYCLHKRHKDSIRVENVLLQCPNNTWMYKYAGRSSRKQFLLQDYVVFGRHPTKIFIKPSGFLVVLSSNETDVLRFCCPLPVQAQVLW